MSITTIELKEYPHYNKLPKWLRYNLNILRSNVLGEVTGSWEECNTIDCNDLEFLNLDCLVEWVVEALPEFDVDFLKASLRIHRECYEEELFDYFGVDESDLFDNILWLKDEYELSEALKGETL